jgi:hypothetical protein
MSGKIPSIGHRPVDLKITPDAIFIEKEKLEIENKEDVKITIVGYKGQWLNQPLALYQAHNGNDNLMKFRFGDKVTEFKFILESEAHKDELIKFCKENGFEI